MWLGLKNIICSYHKCPAKHDETSLKPFNLEEGFQWAKECLGWFSNLNKQTKRSRNTTYKIKMKSKKLQPTTLTTWKAKLSRS
jgi:hypothetical protein